MTGDPPAEEPGDQFPFDVIGLGDQGVLYTHPPEQCAGQICAVHNPSQHPLVNRPQWWSNRHGFMQRMCEHDLPHPDPDDLRVRYVPGFGSHPCDGCCQTPGTVALDHQPQAMAHPAVHAALHRLPVDGDGHTFLGIVLAAGGYQHAFGQPEPVAAAVAAVVLRWAAGYLASQGVLHAPDLLTITADEIEQGGGS